MHVMYMVHGMCSESVGFIWSCDPLFTGSHTAEEKEIIGLTQALLNTVTSMDFPAYE